MKNAIDKLVDVQFSQLTMVELWFQKLNLKKKKKNSIIIIIINYVVINMIMK